MDPTYRPKVWKSKNNLTQLRCAMTAGLAKQQILEGLRTRPDTSPSPRAIAAQGHGQAPAEAAGTSGPTPAGPCEPVWPAEQPPERFAACPAAAPGFLPSLPVWLLHSSRQAWRSSMSVCCGTASKLGSRSITDLQPERWRVPALHAQSDCSLGCSSCGCKKELPASDTIMGKEQQKYVMCNTERRA